MKVSKSGGEVDHVGDDCDGSGSGEARGFVGFVGVADRWHTCGVGCLNVGDGVAEEDARGGFGVEGLGGLG